jgi:hypothetical protein
MRRTGCRVTPQPEYVPTQPVPADPSGVAELVEVDAGDLSVQAIRHGWAKGGCLLVRGLVPAERARRLTAGIDAALASYDAAEAGDEANVDPAWYTPFSMPDRVDPSATGAAVIDTRTGELPPHQPDHRRRKFIRQDGGLWTATSPRMLFELFALVDDIGLGRLMTEFLGDRPYLSANKCTLRRVPPMHVNGGWHQDGAFLGQEVGAFNFWVALNRCGRDAPGLDIVPKRFESVLDPGSDAEFDWSLSQEAVVRAADEAGATIVRPEFEAGDALIFDHLLVHRTAGAPEMTRERYAIESWWFTPTAYPPDQLPLYY